MKKKNKGFTLIELLAVIVILGVLLAIAIPAVSKYINTAKKSTYKENVQSYAKAAKNEFMNIGSDYQLPLERGDAAVITFKNLEYAIENGGKKSSYGNEFKNENSCVIIVNDGENGDPHYTYFIAAMDEKGYAIGTDGTAGVLAYDQITEKNIIQANVNEGINCKDQNTINSNIQEYYSGNNNSLTLKSLEEAKRTTNNDDTDPGNIINP